MALAYHPVTWTGNRPGQNPDYYNGIAYSRAIDYPGNRLYRWVYTDRVSPAVAGAGNHYYDYFHTINPSASSTFGTQPPYEYQSAELVVFDMDTRTEINRWTFPSLWSQFTTVHVNTQTTAEVNAYYTAASGSSYTAATVYDIGFYWGRLTFPDFVQGVHPIVGTDWVVSDLVVFQHIANPHPIYGGNTNWIRYLLAVNVTTGESVLFQAPWDDQSDWLTNVVQVSSSKYAFIVCHSSVDPYGIETKILSYVFDTTTKTWSQTSSIRTSGYVSPNEFYYSGGKWATAAKPGTSGGSCYVVHRRSTETGTTRDRKICLARIDLDSSGQPTAFVPLSETVYTNASYISHMSYIPSDNTIIYNRVEAYPSTTSIWYKINGSTGSTILTNSATDVDGNPVMDPNSKYGYNLLYAMPYENQYGSGHLLAMTFRDLYAIKSRPYVVSTSDLSMTPWSVFATDWAELDSVLGIDSFDESRSGIWTDYNPDPASTDEFWGMDWTLTTHATPPPTMGLCFLEETDAAYKDFQDRYPD